MENFVPFRSIIHFNPDDMRVDNNYEFEVSGSKPRKHISTK